MNLEIKDYPNQIQLFNYTYSDALDKILNLDYVNIKTVLDKDIYEDYINFVEKDKNLPIFIRSFLIYTQNGVIPTLNEFKNHYLYKGNEIFFNDTKIYKLGSLYWDVLEYRLQRIYPSFVRELLCILKAREFFYNYEVIYNEDLDVKKGIDILINKNNKYYGINLYTTTANSLKFKNEKDNFRHDKYLNVEILNLPFNISNPSLNIGNFYLYDNKPFRWLEKIFNSQ
jgi:hypothetical protein